MLDLPVNDRLIIPGSELRIAFARSGGPGGQNVNKVESKVQLRWNAGASAAIAPHDQEEGDTSGPECSHFPGSAPFG